MADRKEQSWLPDGQFRVAPLGDEGLYTYGEWLRSQAARWNGDGTGANREIAKQVVGMPGFVQDTNGELHFADGIAGPVRTMS